MYFKTNNLDVEIRYADSRDISTMQKIESISYGNCAWSSSAFQNELENEFGHYIVACVNNNVVGYAGYWKVLDEGHITNLAVDPLYRRMHVADILLYSLIQKAITNDIKWLTLEVRTNNDAANHLYKKYKFKIIGIRKKYYEDNNDDALILWTNDIQVKEYRTYVHEIFTNDVILVHTDKCN